jgi:hypothetical protein
MSQVLGALGMLFSLCYGPFSLGGRFESYEAFISVIFLLLFFSGRGEPRVLNQWIRGTPVIIYFPFVIAPNCHKYLLRKMFIFGIPVSRFHTLKIPKGWY